MIALTIVVALFVLMFCGWLAWRAALTEIEERATNPNTGNIVNSYRDPMFRQPVAEPKPIIPVFIGYNSDEWFDIASATCWERTPWQALVDRDDSAMWRTADGWFIFRPSTFGEGVGLTPYLKKISEPGAFSWFAKTERFRASCPRDLCEKMKNTKV